LEHAPRTEALVVEAIEEYTGNQRPLFVALGLFLDERRQSEDF
jgi:hypothetical protein